MRRQKRRRVIPPPLSVQGLAGSGRRSIDQIALSDLMQTMTVRYIQQTGTGPVTNAGPCRFEYIYRGGANLDTKFEDYLTNWTIVAQAVSIGQWQTGGTMNYSSEVGNSKTGSCVPGHDGPIPPDNTGS